MMKFAVVDDLPKYFLDGKEIKEGVIELSIFTILILHYKIN